MMTGLRGYSGRPSLPGQVYRFEMRYRFVPGYDPSEIAALFELFQTVRGYQRRTIIRVLCEAGYAVARHAAESCRLKAEPSFRGRLQPAPTIYRVEFYYRFMEGDPAEVPATFNLLRKTQGRQRRAVIRALVQGGYGAVMTATGKFWQEDPEVTALLEAMLKDF